MLSKVQKYLIWKEALNGKRASQKSVFKAIDLTERKIKEILND